MVISWEIYGKNDGFRGKIWKTYGNLVSWEKYDWDSMQKTFKTWDKIGIQPTKMVV